MLVEISELDGAKREVVIETEEGKVRLSFDEWKEIADAFRMFGIGIKEADKT